MPYATPDQVRVAIPAARVGSSEKWTDAVITEWIEEADAIIDGRLAAARVDPQRLPLEPDPVSDNEEAKIIENLRTAAADKDAADEAVADYKRSSAYRRVMLMTSVAARLRRISTALVAYRLMRQLPGSQTEERADDLEMTAQRELSELRADPGSVVMARAILPRGTKRFEAPEDDQ